MLHVRMEPSRIPPPWPSLVVCAVVAVMIDLGTLHRGQHADSLICMQMSLYHWTPFYWELDRVGSLVPWLALPFKSPLTNLLVQEAIFVWFTLAALLLLARYMVRDAAYPILGFVSAAAFIALTPPYYRSEIFFSSYGVWLVFSLSGLLLAGPLPDGRQPGTRLALALVTMIIAHWAYCTAAVFLGPLVVFRAWLSAPDSIRVDATGNGAIETNLVRRLLSRVHRAATPEFRVSLMLLATGCAAGFVIRSLCAPPAGTEWGTLPPHQWPVAIRGLLGNTWQNLAPFYGPLFLAVFAGAGFLLLAIPDVRRHQAALPLRGRRCAGGGGAGHRLFHGHAKMGSAQPVYVSVSGHFDTVFPGGIGHPRRGSVARRPATGASDAGPLRNCFVSARAGRSLQLWFSVVGRCPQ